MADRSSVAVDFEPNDGFLRWIRKKLKGGVVSWEAFQSNTPTLSFTWQASELVTPSQLRQYQLDRALASGDLPAICKLTLRNLTQDLLPPLPPRLRFDPNDEKYGHLHCETDLPTSQEQMEAMAQLATKNIDDVLPLPFVRGKERHNR